MSSSISMVNGSLILSPPAQPSDSAEYHARRNSTTTQADLADESHSSHRASISTDDFSSPRSWDGEGPSDSSPTTTDFDGKLLHSHPHSQPALVDCPPTTTTTASTSTSTSTTKPFAFGLITAHHQHLQQQHQPHFHPGLSMDVTPKIEELDEDDSNHYTQQPETSLTQPPAPPGAPVHVPRKRGRPRKHPLPVPGGQLKITKGRSKTGCITCRRRKKKCDENKPAYVSLPCPLLGPRQPPSLSPPEADDSRCLNCQKNAVVCEGYPPKEIWKSGRQKLEDGALLSGWFSIR